MKNELIVRKMLELSKKINKQEESLCNSLGCGETNLGWFIDDLNDFIAELSGCSKNDTFFDCVFDYFNGKTRNWN